MNLQEQLNRIQEMMGIIIFEEKKDIGFPKDVIEYVYETTPISEYGLLKDYISYVNEYYQDYYITKHSSPNNDILKYDVKTPEQMGKEKYNSVDGFFVTRNLDPYSFSSVGKIGEQKNFYVMIPKDLNFLHTDYNFSNIPDFYKDFKMNGLRSLFKYNGDKVRELGYDVIIPEEGKHEWIVVNPKKLVVLGSINDIKQFLSN